ncbi:tape measure protein [Variovorax sp. SRS16]|uniref:tape measure protein n=1 Tax=Variovorax sp. SRS16 TaxID=282217 RepID=UPI0013A56A31|nr:tape measure protein [Variovorax sp. SRS16]
MLSEAELAGLSAELDAASTKTKALRAAEAAATAQATATKTSIAEQRDALARLRLSTDDATRSTDGYKASIKAAQLALLDSRPALREQSAAQEKAATSARIAAAEEAKLAATYKAAAAAATKASAEQVAAAERSVESVSALSAAGGEAAGVMSHLGPLIAAAFGAHQFIEAITAQQSLLKGFTAVYGSAERAAEEMKFVHDTANRLGLGAQDLQHQMLALSAATRGTVLEGQATRDVFTAVTQAMGSLGRSSFDTERALKAVAQMASTGKVNMTELRRELATDLPGAMQALANGAGITVQQLTAMSESGELLAQDVLPALAKGLTDMYGRAKPPEGIINEWARLHNTIVDTEVAIGEGGASKGIAKGLAWLTLGVRGTSDAFDVAGTAAGEFIAKLVTGNHELGTAAEMNARYDAELRKAAEAAGLIDTAVTGAAAATQAQVRAVDNATMSTEHHAESMLAVQARYSKLATEATAYTTVLEASAKARQTESTALVQLVNVYGSEIERRQAVAQAAGTQAQSLRSLARAREDEAIIAKSHLLKLQEEAAARHDTTEATKQEIKAAQQAADVKRAEADQATAVARSKNIEAEATKANAEAYKDNANRVYELRGAAQAAAAEVERLVDAQKHGKASADQVADAEAKAAAATLLYRDALRDASAAAERKVQAEQRNATLAQGAIGVDLERAQAMGEVAKANNDAAGAARAHEQANMLQARSARVAADGASSEAAAMRAVADAQETELKATGSLTPAKQAEIDATRAAAAAKDQEAQKAEILANKIDGLAAAEKRRADSNGGGNGFSKSGDGFTVDKNGNPVDPETGRQLGQTNLTPLDKAFAAMRTGGKGMSIDDLKAAKAQADAGKAWLDNMVKSGGAGSIGPEAFSSIKGLQAATANALKKAEGDASLAERRKAAADAPAAPAPAPAPAQSTHHTVAIDLGSGAKTIRTASAQDSETLVGMLKTLANARGTAQ